MQLLVALFAFSSHYQKSALNKLENLYATRKLSEGKIDVYVLDSTDIINA